MSVRAAGNSRAGSTSSDSGTGGRAARAGPKAPAEEELPFAVYSPTANAEYWQVSWFHYYRQVSWFHYY